MVDKIPTIVRVLSNEQSEYLDPRPYVAAKSCNNNVVMQYPVQHECCMGFASKVLVYPFADDLITKSSSCPLMTFNNCKVGSNGTQNQFISRQPLHEYSTCVDDSSIGIDDSSISSDITYDEEIKRLSEIHNNDKYLDTSPYEAAFNNKVDSCAQFETRQECDKERSSIETHPMSCASSSDRSKSCSKSSKVESEHTDDSEEESLISDEDSSVDTHTFLSEAESDDVSTKFTNSSTNSLEDEEFFLEEERKLDIKFKNREKVLRSFKIKNSSYKSILIEEERLVQLESRRSLRQKRQSSSSMSRMSSISELGQESSTMNFERNGLNVTEDLKRNGDLIDNSSLHRIQSIVSTLTRSKSCPSVMPSLAQSKTSVTEVESQCNFMSPIAAIRRSLFFEKFHTAPGSIAIISFCIAHQAFFDVMSTLHGFLCTKIPLSNGALQAGTLFLGLFLTRLCGGVFYWLQDTQCTKFALHNKLRLGHMDARIMRWFRCHPRVSEWMDIVGFYLVSMTTATVVPGFLSLFDMRNSFLSDLPSKLYNRHTYARSMLQYSFDEYIYSVEDGGVPHGEGSCLTSDDPSTAGVCFRNDDYMFGWLEHEDNKFVYNNMSPTSYYSIMGYSRAPVVTTTTIVLYNLCWLSLAMYGLKRNGLGFWGKS